jgi:ELWxxDGT repeat protein
VEGGGYPVSRSAGMEVVMGLRDQVGADDPAVLDPAGIGLGVGLPGELLELDRRLTLVADAVADAKQRRGRIEEPAHPGGKRRVHPEALTDLTPAGVGDRSLRSLQVGACHAPWLADRRLAAGQRHRIEVGEALVAIERCPEQLTAPEGAVGPAARAVEHQRQRGTLLAVLGQAGGGVGVVVLHRDRLDPLLERPAGREVIGVEVVGDQLGLEPEHLEVEGEVGAEGLVGERRIEVAEVGGEKCAPVPDEAESTLLLRTDGEDGGGGPGKGDGLRSDAAGAADVEPTPDNGVLAAAVDRAVVGEEDVGDPSEALAGLAVLGGDRLVRAIAGGHHQRAAEVRAEEVVERRVREHHAEPLGARCHRPSDGRGVAPSDQNDGCRRPGQEFPLAIIEVGDRLRIAGHHGQRLRLPVLALAKPGDGGLIGRVAGEVIAAEALDCDDRAAAEQVDDILQRHRQPRTAVRTGDRLGVEAAVDRVLVLGAAGLAHLEARHRRVGAVVRRPKRDRQAGAAVGAVDEGVAVATVGRVPELAQALFAGGDIRGYQRAGRVAGARLDPELALAARRDLRRGDLLDRGVRRSVLDELALEQPEHDGVALNLHDHAPPVVEREAAELPAGGEPVDEGPEADPLHDAADDDPPPLDRIPGRHRGSIASRLAHFQEPSSQWPPRRPGPWEIPIRRGVPRVSLDASHGWCALRRSLPQPRSLVWALALLLAVGGITLWAAGAQAAPKIRGPVLVKDTRPGHAGGIQGTFRGGGPGPQLASISGKLYLTADDGRHGFELWRSDGSRKGTRMVKDINPGAASSYPLRVTPSSGNPVFYFDADDGVHGAELWRSDGTGAGTFMVKDLAPGMGWSGAFELTNVDGTLYFGICICAQGPPNAGLWRSDGTEEGTTQLKQIVDFSSLIDLNGTLYFGGAGNDPTFKIGLWRSDGTAAGTSFVSDITPGAASEITDVNGILYFFGSGESGTLALARSDGTAAGTAIVKDINPAAHSIPRELTNLNGTLYFTVGYGTDQPRELWRSDGTEAGTTLVKTIPGAGQAGIGDLTVFKGKLYFGVGGDDLWRSDGTPGGTVLVRSNCCSSLTPTRDTLYMAGSDRRHGLELWRSNGTRKGTRIVKDIRRGRIGSKPEYLTAVGRTLFFSAKDGRHGRELWKVRPKKK